ncbi:MAG: carbamate kinase [Kribbellaceae bacterium]|nr:carbamate kinase [Kribbellaceae bacterium]
MARTAVVALGGNAFVGPGETGTHAEQDEHASAMAAAVWSIRQAGWNVVLVHGNGPQIGNLAIQQEEGAALVPPQPLFCLDAMTQGQLGSMITMALHRTSGPARPEIAALVTHVVVSLDDPDFSVPHKPIGPFFTEAEARRLALARGWLMTEDSGRGYRRVVPSPEPLEILEAATLRALVDGGTLVIAAGGGGVAVVPGEQGYRGVDAVVDKDYAAQVLATSLGAEALVLLTGVPHVALDFGTPNARALSELSVDEAERYLSEGQFPEGSMGPKVRAGIRFLRSGGRTVVVSTPDGALDALGNGPGGTRMVASVRDVEAAR